MRRPRSLPALALAVGGIIHSSSAVAQSTITECKTIDQPGSYVLDRNLGPSGLLASGRCLDLAAAEAQSGSVTIDLAGFEIVGNGSGIGVFSDSVRSEVRNGIVRKFAIGVTAGIVENVRAFDNTSVGIGAFRKAKGNLAEGNGIGLAASGVVSDNTAELNTGDGISIGDATVAINNTAILNGGIGINASGGSTVMSNMASKNTGIGIQVECPSVVVFNTATNNHPNFVLKNEGNCSAFQNRSGNF